ncbi:tRNA (cytidine(56)-2'-O)-methyltransferase [Candidatus Micrarchaeota archaeon]|nr:tRNA (cytidine(56)-2'-O)-methyltransferase [Candidatus Micrarchaeota archaeon]
MKTWILRLGHRLPRDERITTHVALVARSFGAQKMIYCGQKDQGLEESVHKICEKWGGKTPNGEQFEIEYSQKDLGIIKKLKKEGYFIVHLTMYGSGVMEKMPEIKKQEKILIIVGSEQVEGEVYELSNVNISVTNQPHSEVAALAITLDRLIDGRELETKEGLRLEFGGEIEIEPRERGKKIKKRS